MRSKYPYQWYLCALVIKPDVTQCLCEACIRIYVRCAHVVYVIERLCEGMLERENDTVRRARLDCGGPRRGPPQPLVLK